MKLQVIEIFNKTNHSTLNITIQQNDLLLRLFNDKGVSFPSDFSIVLSNYDNHNDNNITRFNIRGARSILKISQRELCEKLGIKKSELNLLEGLENLESVDQNTSYQNIEKIICFFSKKNILFPNSYTIVTK